MTPKSILFVCWGNICRSPAAENVFRHLIDQEGLTNEFTCDSAGTLGYHQGEPPDSRMQAAGRKRGIEFTGLSRKFDEVTDFIEFDLVLAMDRKNMFDLQALDSRNEYTDKLHLFGEFIDPQNPPEVPDPYYGGKDGFDQVMDLVEEGCRGIIEQLRHKD